MAEKSYLKQVSIAVDQLLNAAICNGWADETMSSVAYRMEQEGHWFGRMRPIIDSLARVFGDKNHCYASYMSERDRNQAPPEFRNA